eukprot:TRINITY_DN16240_c0_g1_i1.p1 TRINITY_DN16240_c0_g1~~TRINITY_DN16240_c0_g1_i1.p1  ORF type:complete len:305 (+),score=68.99 TRINITY_DN16240_c0_g1_i1:38-916(+)
MASVVRVTAVLFGLLAPLCEAASLRADTSGGRLRQAAASQLQVAATSNGNSTADASSFVRSLEFRHTLRVCNAYPSENQVDVYQSDSKITEGSMPYKACQEFQKVQLHTGDRLLFKIGEAVEGSFVVADLPNNDAVLMLVIYRHDASSTAVAFESHVFANLVNAQIAVLDTYKGKAQSKAWIRDKAGQKTARNEELRYDSVVAVNAGVYNVALARTSSQKTTMAKHQLVALNRESYVVLRVGLEAGKGRHSYPEEVVVFPNSDPQALNGGATRYGGACSLVVLLTTFLTLTF